MYVLCILNDFYTNSPIQTANRLSKVECTADVCTIFKCKDNSANPDMGKHEKGHLCMIFKYVALNISLFVLLKPFLLGIMDCDTQTTPSLVGCPVYMCILLGKY